MARPVGSKNKNFHRFSDKEKEYLINNHKGKSYKEIAIAMSDIFNYNFTDTQISSAMARYNLKNGVNKCFKKGNTPWNKGLKGYMGANKTSFKKGTIPPQYRPVGSERVNKEGYLEVKIADPNKWELKHRYIYKKHCGDIPKGHNVIFADTDKTNFNIDNLILVSKSEMLILNRNKLIYKDKELTKAGVNIAKILDKTSKLK